MWLIVIVTIIVVFPISIYGTILLMDTLSPKKSQAKIVTRQDSLQKNIITKVNENFILEYTKPTSEWNHKILDKKNNPISGIRNLELEISNGKSTINIQLSEIDIRFQQNAVNKSELLGEGIYGYVDTQNKIENELILNNNNKLLKTTNTRLGSGIILVDYKSIKNFKIDGAEKLKGNSKLLLLNSLNNQSIRTEIQTQITYNQDTNQNYILLDQIIKSLTLKN